ncbi:MAG: hypothetical protein HY459_02850 [Parcubacteria group bacterium]|nr:hypothetical protein [Parcubacteria group bacterium]
MEGEMDFNQEKVKCAYPPCPLARAYPDNPEAQPFCEFHTSAWEAAFFLVWATQAIQRQVAQAARIGGIVVPQVRREDVPSKSLHLGR